MQILAIDVGGQHVKVLVSGQAEPRKMNSGRKLTATQMTDGVKAMTTDWTFDVISLGYPGQVVHNMPAHEPVNLGKGWVGFDYAAANLPKRDPYFVKRMDKTAGKIIIDGNSAAALGCMFAGVTVVSWYPITPSSSLVESLIDYMKQYRIGKDGKATFAIVQAEDELAAIGMVLGAAWAGCL